MQITFKLYASLSCYLPEGSERNIAVIDVPDDATANSVIDQFNVPTDLVHIVLLNGVYLQPEERSHPVFHAGDTLAIWPPVAGG